MMGQQLSEMLARPRFEHRIMINSLLNPIRYILSDDFALRRRKWLTAMIGRTKLGRYILRRRYHTPTEWLEVETFGMKFPSPIGLAAGYDNNGTMIDAMQATGFGFVEIGSITSQPQRASSSPSLHKLYQDRAIFYNGDIESDGVEAVIENIKRHHSRIIVGCNIAKSSSTAAADAPTEYLRLFRPLYQYADYFSINICCNSTDKPYTPFDRDEVMAILRPLFEFRRGQNQYRPILLKISPDMSDEQIDTMTDIMLETPLDGIVATGGTTGRYGLERSAAKMHAIGRRSGIVCGAPLKKRVLEVVSRIHQRSKGTYPIIACGGISTPDDAMAMLNAGASLLQVGTEYIYGGGKSIRNLREGLNERLRKASQRHTPTEESAKIKE